MQFLPSLLKREDERRGRSFPMKGPLNFISPNKVKTVFLTSNFVEVVNYIICEKEGEVVYFHTPLRQRQVKFYTHENFCE